ncbi:Drug resistance [Lecanosticta acicola]|uniref:Drug resistance n=1 Tax=Lecanosticta acicola TaxID=111012 RepID=A0AAI9E7H7_9PEZI|nr:Drug resistance [Lecanosticta acicola]
MLGPKLKSSFSRISSLDNLITYREEKAERKRASSTLQSASSETDEQEQHHRPPTGTSELKTTRSPDGSEEEEKQMHSRPTTSGYTTSQPATPPRSLHDEDGKEQQPKSRFRHFAAEVGFCFTIAMTQFLVEYMISGFAIELPKIFQRHASDGVGSMGMFWPASLLSLILSATLLIFARASDMYGGYFLFMFGGIWLGIWSVVAGFAGPGVLLDVSRAMQGLAIAASTPSTFAMVGSIYPEGPRKNIVLGLYAGCAPLGFFAGFLVAGALPENSPGWYFWIAAVLSFVTAITAYLTVPYDKTDRKKLDLQMDWAGAFLITAGLILVSYALAVEPYANQGDTSRSGWTFPMVLAPLLTGLACLGVAFWVEGWWAKCPLLPFDFFKPRSTISFSLACLCFYASYGVWLYESANFFQSENATGVEGGVRGLTLAAWYTPTAIGGLLLCVVGGALLHIVPTMILLLISGLAWIAAPLLLALCPLPVSYWAFVMPSMVCATLGIDLTFTISIVFLSSVQPLRYQGLAGAVSSILVNLAMSFSLSISEIVSKSAASDIVVPNIPGPDADAALARQETWGYQTAFIYAAASAGLGLIICVLFVRISRSVVQSKPVESKPVDEERPRPSSEASTSGEV